MPIKWGGSGVGGGGGWVTDTVAFVVVVAVEMVDVTTTAAFVKLDCDDGEFSPDVDGIDDGS